MIFNNYVLANALLEKLDKEAQKAYKLPLTSIETPSLNNLVEFVQSRSVVFRTN